MKLPSITRACHIGHQLRRKVAINCSSQTLTHQDSLWPLKISANLSLPESKWPVCRQRRLGRQLATSPRLLSPLYLLYLLWLISILCCKEGDLQAHCLARILRGKQDGVTGQTASLVTGPQPDTGSGEIVLMSSVGGKGEMIHSFLYHIIIFSWCKVSSVHFIPSVWRNLSRREQMIYNWDHLYIYTFWLRLLGHDSPRSRSLGLKSK